ncbi:unnamed protein product [Spirodela intermedia]|uniref:Homeobox domain-containing protein n=1 Tax=Spirodela intermedia TaxID=51605 RepID=A0A7I8IC10_SPIIN|nr:unnamed protein product [Spirodela intermedia]CAA6655120.1 unnamed protein product [Spirodela intermedia]
MAKGVGAVAASCGGGNSKTTTAGSGSKCGRWNPTAEQVKVLTELFRAGLRTPSTEQIQRISSHLSTFGKIESKNVFYWFQNHKARERLHHKKRRREPPHLPLGHHHYFPDCAEIFPTLPPDQSFRRDAVYSRISIVDREVVSVFIRAAFSEGGNMDDRERETLELFPLSSHEAPPG